MPELEQQFVNASTARLAQLAGRIESCLQPLTEEQIWARGGENENAVGNLVLHLCGNVRQWIISAVGGRPDIRERDAEFAAKGGIAKAELMDRLRATVAEANSIIAAATPSELLERRTIQGYEGSVLEAIYHVVEHFAMHTGQIIFATKMMTGRDLGFYAHLRSSAAHGQKTP
jgi:uncharacterized damage-inducible protein DinB